MRPGITYLHDQISNNIIIGILNSDSRHYRPQTRPFGSVQCFDEVLSFIQIIACSVVAEEV